MYGKIHALLEYQLHARQFCDFIVEHYPWLHIAHPESHPDIVTFRRPLPSNERITEHLASLKELGDALQKFTTSSNDPVEVFFTGEYHRALQGLLFSASQSLPSLGRSAEASKCLALSKTLSEGGSPSSATFVYESSEPIHALSGTAPIRRSAENKKSPPKKFVEEVLSLRNELEELERTFVETFRNRSDASNFDQVAEERIERGDKLFTILNESNAKLGELREYVDSTLTDQLAMTLQDISRKALRYNRESPAFLHQDPISVIPITHNRNFLREEKERMYFLALHGLPAAYDMFCGTFTETPIDYTQELHLHRYSEELSLILRGDADCVWYRENTPDDFQEIGRVSAGPLEAFRIPPGVVHTIHNPRRENANITVKLTMFINDRVGTNDWELSGEEKSENEVTLELGSVRRKPWGKTITYDHGHGELRYQYRVDVLEPGKKLKPSPKVENFLLLVRGTVAVENPSSDSKIAVRAGNIIRIEKGVRSEVQNLGEADVLLFSVKGLDYKKFLEDPDRYPGYPSWYLRNLAWTMGE